MNLSTLNVTTQKANQFQKKGIFTGEDLIQFLPRKYQDFTRETGILPDTEISCLTILINEVRTFHSKTPMMLASGVVEKTGENISIKWFNQNYMSGRIFNCKGRSVYVAGKVSYDDTYKNYSITAPLLFEPNLSEGPRVVPVYSKITGMSVEYLTEKIREASGISLLTEESCPYELVSQMKLLSRKEALYKLHFPVSMEHVRQGQERMLFDDLLYFAIRNEWALRSSAVGSQFSIKTLKGVKAIKDSLPYALTKDQDETVNSILDLIRQGKRINSLVQGDVGCGKSIVSFLMMVAMADSGYQAVLMAPTQVLARQHYADLCELVTPLGYKVAYLGGSDMKKSEKNAVLKMIASGEANLIVGTHSVVAKGVEYANLAMTIADEEHKFGVAQRSALVEKASAGVHSITMSATPIPRSLAQVVYGNSVQLYTIKTMPHGRMPVNTGIATTKEKLYRFIVSQAKKGLQTYVVCPMIDQNEDMEGVKSVEEVRAEYQAALGPHGIRIETLTGKNKKAEVEDIVGRFKAGEVDVLIATTVIEVGVNVPTATTMVITNAERFGLSSLHQLRGRVGRGKHQSFCVLESETQTPDGLQRVNAMVETTDGFKIAEADLAIRGAGDFLGTRQSGDDKYMALMLAHPEKYETAQAIARQMLDDGTDCRMMRRVQEDLAESVS